jgi:hypothetical protein
MMRPIEEMGLRRGCDMGKRCSMGRRCASKEKIGPKKKHSPRRRCVSKDGGDETGEKRFVFPRRRWA